MVKSYIVLLAKDFILLVLIQVMLYLLIHSGYFYGASSSPLLLRSASNTGRILCCSFTLKRHRQLRVKDLPKFPTWWLERDSNPQPFGRKASNLPMSHHAPRQVATVVLGVISFIQLSLLSLLYWFFVSYLTTFITGCVKYFSWSKLTLF